MENEAFFLNVCYILKALPGTQSVDEKTGKVITDYPFEVTIKRATMQRREQDIGREAHKISRVKIEFDALGQQLAYAVICRGSQPHEDNPNSRLHNVVKACGVFLKQEEAEKLRAEAEAATGKPYLVKKEKFDSVFVEPVLISQN